MLEGSTTRRRVLVLLLVALAARALTFGNPIVHADEQFYFVVAEAMWRGQLPIVDIWDRKPLGLFLLYMPAALLPLPWGTLAYQALALGCAVGAAAIVARLAALAGWERGALAAGTAYILWLNPLNGSSGQSPAFYNLLVAAAAALVIIRPGRHAGLAAMTLVGLALQIKSAVVFEGVFLGLWLLADEWRRRGRWPALLAYASALVGIAILPTAAAWGYYALLGHHEAWWQANVVSVLERRPDPAWTRWRNGLKLALLLSPLVAMAFGSRGQAEGGSARVRAFLWSWFAVALSGLVVFGGWYDHYGLPVALPGAAAAAGYLGGRGRPWAVPLLLAVALAGQLKVGIDRWAHGDGADLARLAAAVGRGPEPLFVYSGPTLLYPLTGRPPLTRFMFPSHLHLGREERSIGVLQAQEIARILSRRPAVIVMEPYRGAEERRVRALVERAVARDYRRSARVPVGRAWVSVYRRR